MQRILWERLRDGFHRSQLSLLSPQLPGVHHKGHRRWPGIVMAILVLALTMAMTIWPVPTRALNVNVLYNGGFEEGFSNREGCGAVGDWWQCFTNDGAANYGFYDDQWERTVSEGKHSQLIEVNTKGIMVGEEERYAGIYQTVPVVAGTVYTLSLSGMIQATNMERDAGRHRVEVGWTAGPVANWDAVSNWKDVGWDKTDRRAAPSSFLSYNGELMVETTSVTVYVRVWEKWGAANEEIDVNLDAIGLYGRSPYGNPVGPSSGAYKGVAAPLRPVPYAAYAYPPTQMAIHWGYAAHPVPLVHVEPGCGATCGGDVKHASDPDDAGNPSLTVDGGGDSLCAYTVRPGDTLGRVARSMGMSQDDLMAENGVADPNLLQVGQLLANPNCDQMGGGHGAVLVARYGTETSTGAGDDELMNLPVTHGPAYPQADAAGGEPPVAAKPVGNNSYVVVAGDNLSRVAAAHGVSVRQLVLANSILDPDRIAVGQLLFIP